MIKLIVKLSLILVAVLILLAWETLLRATWKDLDDEFNADDDS